MHSTAENRAHLHGRCGCLLLILVKRALYQEIRIRILHPQHVQEHVVADVVGTVQCVCLPVQHSCQIKRMACSVRYCKHRQIVSVGITQRSKNDIRKPSWLLKSSVKGEQIDSLQLIRKPRANTKPEGQHFQHGRTTAARRYIYLWPPRDPFVRQASVSQSLGRPSLVCPLARSSECTPPRLSICRGADDTMTSEAGGIRRCMTFQVVVAAIENISRLTTS